MIDHPLGEHIGFMLRRAQLVVFQDFQRRTAGLDLTPAAYSVLVIVDRQPGIRQNRLTEMLAIKPANCVTLINGMEKQSLLVREKVRVSGRAVALNLTDRGRALLAEANRKVGEHLTAMRERLGNEDAVQLLQLLHKLVGSGGDALGDGLPQDL